MSQYNKVIEPFFDMIDEVCEENEEVSPELGKHFFENYFKHMRQVAKDDKVPIMIFPGIGTLKPNLNKIEDKINKLRDDLDGSMFFKEKTKEAKLEQLKFWTERYKRLKKDLKNYESR